MTDAPRTAGPRATSRRRGGGRRADAGAHPDRLAATGATRRRRSARPRRRTTAPQRLREVGLDPEIIVTTSDARRAVHVRIPGTDPTAGALLLHGHIDVVPAMAEDWSHPPFAAEVADGFVWGRGAVDMKDMDAMILAVVRSWARDGVRPRRDVVVLLPARRGGRQRPRLALARRQPARPLRGRHRGGRRGRRLLADRARRPAPVPDPDGREGHPLAPAAGQGPRRSRLDDPHDNAVTALCEAVAKVGRHTVADPAHEDRRPLPRGALRGLRRRPRPRRARRGARPPRHAGAPRRRHPAEHRQPDDAPGRLQAQRHPGRGRRQHRRPRPARLRGRVRGDDPPDRRATPSRSSPSSRTSRSRRRSTRRPST